MAQSAFPQTDSLKLPPLDSLNKLTSFQWVKDSLTLEAWSSTMKTGIQSKFNTDSLHLKMKIDSLSSLRLPTEWHTSKLDSLSAKKQNMMKEVNGKQKELLDKTQNRISAWKQKVQTRLDSLGIKRDVPGARIPTGDLPGANLPSANLPGVSELNIPDLDFPEMPSLDVKDFSEMELSPDLSKINADLPFSTPEGLSGIQENLTGIKEKVSGLGELKSNPDKVIEQAVSGLDGVKEMEKFNDLKNPMDQLPTNNQDAVKEKLKKQAMNHFAGKEELLTNTMEQVSKYKQKYSNVQSLKDLPKKSTNEMKDKPFIERLVPGISFQYQFNNNYLLDIYSYAGYRLTGRITAGLGWNQRLARDKDNTYWNHKASIYGPRAFGNYRLGKGFIAQIEMETMNAFVSYSRTDPEIGKREWVWGTMTGMKKEYRITKNFKGTVLVLYNIIDPRHKSPYNDRLNTRIGFEYTIKKKQKQTEQN